MTNKNSCQPDDQLGEVLRAFVDRSLSAGRDPQSIIYAMAIATIRQALDVGPESNVALASVLKATADIALLHSSCCRQGNSDVDSGD